MKIAGEKQQVCEKPFIAALRGEVRSRPPFWLMRQAGRYLPEYRETRASAGGFLDLVYNPVLAAEVTMQPLRRYGMDAAILFSDILVVPQALGQKLDFIKDEGPKLEPVTGWKDLGGLAFNETRLAPIYQTVSTVCAALAAEGFDRAALIGFAGAPWTVATYMVEGGSSRDFSQVKRWAYAEPESFSELIDLVTEATIAYLSHQVRAGAEVLQLFDSWAGVLAEEQYHQWVIAPTRKIAAALARIYPGVPLIGFPRGSGLLYEDYARESGVSALGLDSQVKPAQAQALQKHLPVQGNLDPVCLLVGGRALTKNAETIIDALKDGPFIFNLGHGVIKETPPEHVMQLAALIRGEA